LFELGIEPLGQLAERVFTAVAPLLEEASNLVAL